MRKAAFIEHVKRARNELRGINLVVPYQCRFDGVLLVITWQDSRLRKHDEIICTTTPEKLFSEKAKCQGWLNNI
ncbi:TPA: hypothetical protein ACF7ZB_000193 [Kluyvera georgiana]